MAEQRRPRSRDRAEAGGTADDQLEMLIQEVRRTDADEAAKREGYVPVTQVTSRGNVECRLYPVEGAEAGAIFVGGAGGGFDTPVRGWLYPRLCTELQGEGLSCLRVRYRRPNDLAECVLDVLAGLALLHGEGVKRAALVGHSFGGAVVIQAAAMSAMVKACAPLSTQTYGVDPAAELGPRCSLWLGHGTADEVLPPTCSEYVYSIAREPKQLLLKDGARHGLDEWADELPGLLKDWIVQELSSARRR